ncbi:DsbA family protein [Pedobacter nutrimenti]|uniref:DsbA family protein n=1 Tax=Pedobacter nutrimenti TaxID=1241337 RepID=UPI00292DF31A|nr:DsbA family protein [Pedobacter nutrimenti]
MKLLYIMDPLCGWCYGNGNNTMALFETYPQFDFEIIPAGMWAGQNSRIQSPQMASYFQKHDLQIARLTGTTFGEAYFDFIGHQEIKLDSEIPSRAIITVQESWKAYNVPFMYAVQQARYLYGKDLNLEETYLNICDQLKIDRQAFLEVFHSEKMHLKTQESFHNAIQYASSYPSLLVNDDNHLHLIEQGYSELNEVKEKINSLISNHKTNS